MIDADFLKDMQVTGIAMVKDVVRETEKAIQIDAGDRLVWVPKSLTVIDDGDIYCKNWFAKKNGIGRFGYRSVLVG